MFIVNHVSCFLHTNCTLSPPCSFLQTQTWHGPRGHGVGQWVPAEMRRVKSCSSIHITDSTITRSHTADTVQFTAMSALQWHQTEARIVRECDKNVTRRCWDPDGPLDAVHWKHQEGGWRCSFGYHGGTVREVENKTVEVDGVLSYFLSLFHLL